MTKYLNRKYMGHTILECEAALSERGRRPHAGKWIVQTYHKPTGMPFADEMCPHFGTLLAARHYIIDRTSEAAAYS